jgi:four helix bundle protein
MNNFEESYYPLDRFELYNLARKFRQKVYKLIKQLPPAEKYCLDSQMRDAIISVTNNIAEGHGRWHYKEKIRFGIISRGSVSEILDDLNIGLDEGYGEVEFNTQLKAEGYTLISKINGYISYLRKCKQGEGDPSSSEKRLMSQVLDRIKSQQQERFRRFLCHCIPKLSNRSLKKRQKWLVPPFQMATPI